MAEGFNVQGIEETIHKLGDLEQKMEKSIVRKSTRAGCKVMVAAAKAQAPVLSGKTQANVKIRAGKKESGSYHLTVGVGAKDFTGESFYASFVLYGHHVGSRKLGDARTFVPANNWLERAYDGANVAVVDEITGTLKDLVDDAANG